MWPRRYSASDDPESLTAFVLDRCLTYNEANPGSPEPLPPWPFVPKLCELWWNSRKTGEPLIVEKSRRLGVSWLMRSCELWAMGLRPERRIVAGLDYDWASEMVWRVWWLYEQVNKKFWRYLPPCRPRGGNVQAGKIEQVILPNGSYIVGLNQEKDTLQGSGFAGVNLEEFSLYRFPDAVWSQAHFVTQAQAGSSGGHVVVTTNANGLNLAWKEIKR